MFRRLHIHMTLFSTLITGIILSLMAAACLLITESNIRQNHYTIFTNNAYSCISYLESQNVLSHRWIQQAQNNYHIQMQILDGQHPLFFDRLHENTDLQDIFSLAKKESKENHGLDLDSSGSSQALSKVAMFQIPGYYACTARIPKKQGSLHAVFLYSQKEQVSQILRMRLLFLCAVLTAILALAVFSWLFTRKMIRPLEKSRKEQNAFIAAASHELRSPLAVIQSSLSAIPHASKERADQFVSISLDECRRMSRLIQDMLSLSRSDNHTWILNAAPCEVDTLLLETFEKYQQPAREKGKKLQIRLPEDPLPVCICDPEKISQILTILIDNALSYVPEGGNIRLQAEKEPGSIAISVSDNGPGIPDSEKDSVFQRFYRSDASRNDKQHFGLGLCIAKEIALLHQGSLKILDTPGGGATFVLKLPLQKS